uniref:Androgen-dependent TFPI-regulating protein-like n=1 Tax=Parastrongyloides trichosuri TaxID=131310 RepID=A0A0N4Z673_PARTI
MFQNCGIPFFIVNAIIWSFSLYYDIYILTHLYTESWTEKLVMLTNINFLLLTIHSYIILMTIFLPKVKFLTAFRDYTYFTIIFPVAILTCILFWGLYLINPELVMPSWAYQQIPPWINHITHSYPLITVILEIIFTKHQIPSSKRMATFVTMTAFIGYILLLIHFYVKYGIWLYPIFHYISPLLTIIILSSAAVLMISFSNLAIFISSKIHHQNHLKIKRK